MSTLLYSINKTCCLIFEAAGRIRSMSGVFNAKEKIMKAKRNFNDGTVWLASPLKAS